MLRTKSHWCNNYKCKKCGGLVVSYKPKSKDAGASLQDENFISSRCQCVCHKIIKNKNNE